MTGKEERKGESRLRLLWLVWHVISRDDSMLACSGDHVTETEWNGLEYEYLFINARHNQIYMIVDRFWMSPIFGCSFYWEQINFYISVVVLRLSFVSILWNSSSRSLWTRATSSSIVIISLSLAFSFAILIIIVCILALIIAIFVGILPLTLWFLFWGGNQTSTKANEHYHR